MAKVLGNFVLYGHFADLPTDNTALTQGRLYFTDDTAQIFLDLASAWVNVTPSGSGGAKTLFVLTSTPSIGNSTTPATLLGSTGVGSLTLPANWFAAGRGIEVELDVELTTVASPGNFHFEFQFNGVQIYGFGFSALPASADLAGKLYFRAICTDFTDPTNAVISTAAELILTDNGVTPVFAAGSNGTGLTMDVTPTLAMEKLWAFSVADPDNTIVVNLGTIREISAPA